MKTHKPRVVVEVSGGVPYLIGADLPVQLIIVDWDNIEADPRVVDEELGPAIQTRPAPKVLDRYLRRAAKRIIEIRKRRYE